MAYPCQNKCRVQCSGSDTDFFPDSTESESPLPPSTPAGYLYCCAGARAACPNKDEAIDFRRADGKLYEGKTEIGGVDVPKILVALGIAVGAYFIMKKVK